MTPKPSEAVKLYGTEEPSPRPLILQAGSLSAEFDAGNLRHIRCNGVEVIRAISFIVRDRNWGTCNPTIDDLRVEQSPGRFSVSYAALAKDTDGEFRYRATIQGTSAELTFRAEGEAVTDFVTNRTGFVVLHPVNGVAGHGVEIEHVDGEVVEGRFPELIDPIQPMKNLRALTHEPVPGLRVTCRMEGDAFEMEDQRNWTDASYKTYVRPLALPWPYRIEAGAKLEQSVSLSIAGTVPPARSGRGPIRVALGEPGRQAPSVGLGFDPDEAQATRSVASALSSARPHHLVCHYDPRRGHDRGTLAEAAEIAALLGAEPWLEAVVADVDGFAEEVAALGATVAALGAPFKLVLLSPAADLRSTPPGSVWPPAPPARSLFEAARRAFPGVRLGGGMFSHFPELNRKRPAVDLIDVVSFTTSALVHAGDDASVMEGLESLPWIAASARTIAGDRPFAVGPSAIGLRFNPNGAAPAENPRNIRQAMSRNDPRQRGLLGAAWTIGYYAHMAQGGAEAVTFGGTTGPFGLVHTPQDWPAPWYEDHGGLYPLFHAFRGLATADGGTMRQLSIGDLSAVQGIAFDTARGNEIWLANLTPNIQEIEFAEAVSAACMLDASCFIEASRSAEFMDRMREPAAARAMRLDAFGLARAIVAS